MGETITLTDDIHGPTVPADERITFTVDGTVWEIDLTADHAAALRAVFTMLDAGDTEQVRATMDGHTRDAHVPPDVAAQFRVALAKWTAHARRGGTRGTRVRSHVPTHPVIDPDDPTYWHTPPALSAMSKAAAPWRELRANMRTWGAANGWADLSSRGRIPHPLGRAYALAQQGRSHTTSPDETDHAA